MPPSARSSDLLPVPSAFVDEALRYTQVLTPDPERYAPVVGRRDDELGSGPGVAALVNLKAQALAAGTPQRAEIAFERPDGVRWYDVTVTPVKGAAARLLAAAVDVTEQHRLVESLRARETHHAFLAELDRALRPIADPHDIQHEAARRLATHLDACRAGYAEDGGDDETVVVTRSYNDGVPAIDGRYRYIDYGPELIEALRAGRTVLRPDVANDPMLTDDERAAHETLQLGATLNVPLRKRDRLAAILFVHTTHPRAWTPAEAALCEAVAERTWAAVEQARADAARRESEERLRFALEVAEVGQWDLDLERHTAFRSLRHDQVFGYDELLPEWTYERFLEHVLPEYREEVDTAFTTAVERGEDWNFECRIRRGDGALRWIWARGRVWQREDGTPRRMLGVVGDVTERREREVALRRSEERQAFLLALSDALRGLSEARRVMALAAELLARHVEADRVGYAEVDDERGTFVVHADWGREGMPSIDGEHALDAFGAPYIAELRAGRPVVVEDVERDPIAGAAGIVVAYRAIRTQSAIAMPLVKDGRLAAALFVHSAVPRAWTPVEMSLADEVAERTWAAVGRARAETALRKSEDEYRVLLESMDEGFCLLEIIFDDEGRGVNYRYLEVNPAFVRQTGMQGAVGRTVLEMIPDIEPFWALAYGRVARTGRDTHFVDHAVSMGRWFEVNAFRVGGPGSHRVAVFFSDITERKEAEQALVELNRTLEERVRARTAELEERNRELQHFAYVASHDLREPLRKIRTFAGLVREEAGAALDDETVLFLDRMSSAAARMDGLLGDLLAFSRIATRQNDLTALRLSDVVADVLADYDVAADETDAEIDVAVDLTIEADRSQLRQLLTNLVGNAFKYRRTDVPLHLRITAETVDADAEPDVAAPDGRLCRLTVEDNGIGFDPAYRERIFEPFQRLHGRDVYDGSGMGLAICRRIAHRHGGRMWAESAEGEGARFVVVLPVQQPPAPSDD